MKEKGENKCERSEKGVLQEEMQRYTKPRESKCGGTDVEKMK